VEYVVLDTDVASLSFRRRLPPQTMAFLAGKLWCVTFVTVGEMTQWAELRNWSPRNQAALDAWLSERVFLDVGREVARTWGRLSADGKRRGRTHPISDGWIAASCLTEGLPLATFNTKDFADFVTNHGLALLGLDRGAGTASRS
jgi:predicted nucleic acid-binding protein